MNQAHPAHQNANLNAPNEVSQEEAWAEQQSQIRAHQTDAEHQSAGVQQRWSANHIFNNAHSAVYSNAPNLNASN